MIDHSTFAIRHSDFALLRGSTFEIRRSHFLRLRLHKEFDEAFASTQLPERPDYAWANEFLLKARRGRAEQAVSQKCGGNYG